MPPSICVVTPVKNESRYIRFTLDSVIAQKVRPAKWVVVDDGSEDDTAEIVSGYLPDNEWITLLRLDNTGEPRAGGSKVVQAFYRGFSLLQSMPFDYIVKLDGDLTLPPDYFARMLAEFDADPKLGICGGKILNKFSDSDLRAEATERYHVRGALKMLRRTCWESIGGFKEFWNWDGLDIIEANYKGWHTRSIDVPVIHHRPTSAAYDPVKHAYRSGYESYRLGADLPLTLVRALVRIKRKPYFRVALSFFGGYRAAWREKAPLVVPKSIARHGNRMHYRRLFRFN
jgi:poly-beta-1,6-N-acetyl-D-glucosamine synthase